VKAYRLQCVVILRKILAERIQRESIIAYQGLRFVSAAVKQGWHLSDLCSSPARCSQSAGRSPIPFKAMRSILWWRNILRHSHPLISALWRQYAGDIHNVALNWMGWPVAQNNSLTRRVPVSAATLRAMSYNGLDSALTRRWWHRPDSD